MIDTLESPYIHAATHDNFQSLVIDNSNVGPVLVNFWSPKAGPCLRQYPVLDKVIHHYEGRLLLINIDTQTEVKVPKEYGITSVPTLKLIRNGEVVETLHGYQSEEELIDLLDAYVARDSDKILTRVIELYSNGEQESAYEQLADAILNDPVNPRLPLAMCKLLRHEARFTEALKLIESLPDKVRKLSEFNQLQADLYFLNGVDSNVDVEALLKEGEGQTDDLSLQRQFVNYYVIQKNFEQAFLHLVNIIEADPHFENNFAQTAMLTLFALVGDGDPLIKTYRPYLKQYTH
ncbi:MAG: tetratricopeptide repeat protein [Gammaproteobacteria bacterium]|nr:tetratricopeptide repeat protein [Gammaproteobacteria bacterium]